jgi:hypothetical protein
MGSVAAGKRKWAAKRAYPTAADMLILTGLRLFKNPLPWIDGVGRSDIASGLQTGGVYGETLCSSALIESP